MPKWYKINPGRDREMFAEFIKAGHMAVRFNEFGDIRGLTVREMLQLPNAESPVRAAELHTFVNHVRPDDRIVLYDQRNRRYILGTVTSEYEHRDGHHLGYHHFYGVRWGNTVPKDLVSPENQSVLSRRLAFYACDEVGPELEPYL
ncbi:MAG TPA: hypothetical protein VNT01_13495 [Symbiobacteriaceae bacterium]|nr:hypothetical protein [Symbiobacteriaceae bacterium]